MIIRMKLLKTMAGMVVATFMVSAIGACSKESPPQPVVQDTGRADTRSIEAANTVGYNGTAMRQKVDQSLNAKDAVTQQMNDAANQ